MVLFNMNNCDEVVTEWWKALFILTITRNSYHTTEDIIIRGGKGCYKFIIIISEFTLLSVLSF